MLVFQFRKIVSDLISEESRFGLVSLLEQAKSLSSNRGSISEKDYQEAAKNIRKAAADIKVSNIFNFYSAEEIREISDTKLSILLPNRISDIILSGISASNKINTATSSEFSMYINEAKSALANSQNFFSLFNGEPISFHNDSEDKIAFQLSISRKSFENEFGALSKKITSFDRLFLSLSEFYNIERKSPNILYISTSDPNFWMQWTPAAVAGLIALYGPMLEAAEKTVNLIKSIKELFGPSDKTTKDLEERLRKQNQEQIEQIIRNHLESHQSPLNKDREDQVKSEIIINAVIVSKEIARGSRLSFGTELPDKILESQIFSNAEDIINLISHQKSIEVRLNDISNITSGQKFLTFSENEHGDL